MVKNFQLACELFYQNKFEKAHGHFIRALDEDGLERVYKIECYKFLLRVLQFLRREKEFFDAKYNFAEYLSQNLLWEEAFVHYKDLLDKKGWQHLGILYYKLWNCCWETGKVSESRKYIRDCLEYLYKKKNIVLGLKYLKELFSKNIERDLAELYYVKFLVLQEDVNGINLFLNEKKAEPSEENKKIGFFSKVYNLIHSKILNWQKADSIYELYLKKALEKLKEGNLDEEEIKKRRKTFINLLLEYLLHFPNRTLGHKLLLEYSTLFNKKKILEELSTFFEENKSFFWKERPTFNYFKESLSKIDQIEANAEDLFEFDLKEEYDFAGDLFEKEMMESDSKEAMIRRLERDIKFLLNAGDKEKAGELIEDLKKLDKNNDLVASYEASEKPSTEISEATKVRSVEEVKRDLIEEISKSGSFDLLEDDQLMIEETILVNKKYVNNINDFVLRQYYRDLAVAFKMMEIPEISLYILELVEERGLIDSEINVKLSYEYLRIICLMDNKLFREAASRIAEILSKWPLLAQERICFLYLKAEIYLALGLTKKALKIYGEIRKATPEYRLVEQRLYDFEKN